MPTIDIKDVIASVVTQTKSELMLVIPEAAKEAIYAVTTVYLPNLENRAKSLLEELQESNDAAFLTRRIKEEPAILETEVFSLFIIGKGLAQNIANSIQNIILTAVQLVLPVGI